MLAYCKMILEKMSIDKGLFLKELKKAFRMISPGEVEEFSQWVMLNYSHLVKAPQLARLRA